MSGSGQLDSPALSILVPFYNSGAHIAACVDALLTQEGVEGGYELIFIDNGSTDGSLQILQEYDGLEILSEAKDGAYAARNAGIRHASAPILAFTDADCTPDRDWARSIQEGMEDPAIGLLVGRIRYPRNASLTLRTLGAYENAKLEYVLDRGRTSQQFAHANNMAVRAYVFDDLGLFKEWKRAGDTELLHRIAAERPDIRVEFRPEMRVTHNEFVSSRDRMKRLRLYSRTNAKISDFRELSMTQRLAIVARMLRGLRER